MERLICREVHGYNFWFRITLAKVNLFIVAEFTPQLRCTTAIFISYLPAFLDNEQQKEISGRNLSRAQCPPWHDPPAPVMFPQGPGPTLLVSCCLHSSLWHSLSLLLSSSPIDCFPLSLAVFPQAQICSSSANLSLMLQSSSPLCPKTLTVTEYLI